MQNEWFFKWHFIGKEGPVEIESFNGKPIYYGGVKFFGSPRLVYWDTIQRYLRKKVASTFDDLENELQKYPVEIRLAALSEAKFIVGAFAAKIRRTAIEKDRILRGNGFEFPAEHDQGNWAGCLPHDINARIESLKAIYCDQKIVIDGVEMALRSLAKDKVTLSKKDGTIVRTDIAASVQSGRIFVFDASLPIEVGDHFLRQLPNGLVEDFVVDDPGFMTGLHGIQSHFQTRVHRSDQPVAQPQTVINNIVGHNARININSTDNSTNSVGGVSSELFAEILKAVAAIDNQTRRDAISSAVSDMAAAQARNDGSFKEKYQNFMAAAADHVTIIAPFLPALTKLL